MFWWDIEADLLEVANDAQRSKPDHCGNEQGTGAESGDGKKIRDERK